MFCACGAPVELVTAAAGGCIEETVWTREGLCRKVRPATFYACTACEWCEEFNTRKPATVAHLATGAALE